MMKSLSKAELDFYKNREIKLYGKTEPDFYLYLWCEMLASHRIDKFMGRK